MNNFFETYLEWIIGKYNDGENINDILTSGYTANTGTYYCPECTYFLGSVNIWLNYLQSMNTYGVLKNCCTNVICDSLFFIQINNEVGFWNTCCPKDKFCLQNNFSDENLNYIITEKGIVERGSSSEIYNTNLCYLFDRLQEEYSESQVFDIFNSLLDNGIVIWCCNGIIYAGSYNFWITKSENCDICIVNWQTQTYLGQSQIDACNTTSVTGPNLYTETINLQIGDTVYTSPWLVIPFDGNNNWFPLIPSFGGCGLDITVVQINNNGEIIDIGCPTI